MEKFLNHTRRLMELREARPTTMGGRIKLARTLSGLTQEQLAKECGVTRSAVALWESDQSKGIDGLTLMKLAMRLQVAARWIVLMDDTPTMYRPYDPDTARLMDSFEYLTEDQRSLILTMVDAFSLQNKPTVSKPHSVPTPPPHKYDQKVDR